MDKEIVTDIINDIEDLEEIISINYIKQDDVHSIIQVHYLDKDEIPKYHNRPITTLKRIGGNKK